ncbi:MAG: helix-turn-helix domain-containing protein [Blautia sp.]|nr:helix-turn-helix domain-containing protein [Blautia sp.]
MGEFKNLMFDMLAKHASIQEILNEAAREMNRPMWLMNQAFLPLYFSEEPGAKQIWDQSFAGQGQLDSQILSWEKDGHLAAMFTTEEVVHHYNALLGLTATCGNAISWDGRRMYLAIFTPGEVKEGISSKEKAEVLPSKEETEVLLKTISLCMDQREKGEALSSSQAVLLSLLEGILPPGGNLNLAGFSEDREYRLIYALGKKKVADGYLPFLTNNLSSHLGRSLLTVYQGGILILTEGKEDFSFLSSHLSSEYVLGVSWPFKGARQVKAYGRQAVRTARYCIERGKQVAYYDEVMLTDIAEHLDTEEEGLSFCSPDIQKAASYDEEYGTEYIRTLKGYIAMGGNRKEACEYLGIHPNTLKYRLSQLRQLFSLDVTNLQKVGEMEVSIKLLELYREKT